MLPDKARQRATPPASAAELPQPTPEAFDQREQDRPATPIGQEQEGDILNPLGNPFKNMASAITAQRKAGEGFEIVRVAKGLVMRQKESDVQDATPATAAQSTAAPVQEAPEVGGVPAEAQDVPGAGSAAVEADGVEPQAFEYAGLKVYPTRTRGVDGKPEMRWAVQLPENRDTGKALGDTLHRTPEEAKAEAELIVRRAEKQKKDRAELAARDAAATEEAAKRKEANKGKTLQDMRADATLDKQTRDEDGKPVPEADPQKAGIVWTDAELRERFNLDDKQRGLYREFRKAVDKSLTDLVVSDMIRFGGKDVEAVAQQAREAGSVSKARDILTNHIADLTEQEPERAGVLLDTGATIGDKAGHAYEMMRKGYAPLTRFGHYTLDVTQDGERVWIVKPGENSNRGKGITVHSEWEGLRRWVAGEIGGENNPRKTLIVQKYISRPLLYHRRKFDIRCYILITTVNGRLKGYWYNDGYIRTSSEEYEIGRAHV